jgi:hypothetical protein
MDAGAEVQVSGGGIDPLPIAFAVRSPRALAAVTVDRVLDDVALAAIEIHDERA